MLQRPAVLRRLTLARMFAAERDATFFDLEAVADPRRLQNPELALAALSGLAVLDEIQTAPKLTPSMRSALETLRLDHLRGVHPGRHACPMPPGIDAVPLAAINEPEMMIQVR
jgi:hypothetical protein